MRKPVNKTGRYGLGLMVRLAHISGSVPDTVEWYRQVLGGVPTVGYPEPDYLEPEDRFMTLVMVGDLCIEVMAPAVPVREDLPVGKFHLKHGSRLHSIGTQVDDPVGLARHLTAQGARIAMPGGHSLDEMTDEVMYFFPHPRDVGGMAVELGDFSMVEGTDVRTLDGWDEFVAAWDDHPTGIRGLSHVTFAVADLEAAARTCRKMWQLEPFETGEDDDLGTRYFLVRFGDCVLEFAQPVREGTVLQQVLARDGDMLFGLTLVATDLDVLDAHLKAHGVATTRPRPSLLVTDPSDTLGIPMSFSTRGAGAETAQGAAADRAVEEG
jgi:hypothetical protein